MEYDQFVASKRESALDEGFEAKVENEGLYPFQRHITEWAPS
jgi:hypothetical protein